LYPTQLTEVGPALGSDELAADKMLALFGRAEPRDFVDVYRLRRLYGREDWSSAC
jgi:predicted nucleotidyltransferase component of viral defense system